MSKIKKSGIAIILTVLVIVSTLLILSNNIKGSNFIGGVDLGIDSFYDIGRVNRWRIPYTGELAWFASNYPKEFVTGSIANVFDLNRQWTNGGRTYRGLVVDEAGTKNTYDVYYPSTLCLYHAQANNIPDDGFVYSKVTNVIDVDSSGKASIYKATEGTGYYGQEIELTSAEKKEISAFAYLLHKAVFQEQYIYGQYSTKGENAIGYWWAGMSNQQSIRRIFSRSGYLDPIYDCQNTEEFGYLSGDANVTSLINESKNAAQSMGAEPKVTIVQGSNIGVEYINNKAYVGPLKINYQGGKLSVIKVNNNNANWVTKNTNGGYSSEKTAQDVISNQTIYLVIDKSKVEASQTIQISAKLDYTAYKGRLVLVANEEGQNQELMNFAATETQGSKTANTEIYISTQEELGEIEITKVDAYNQKFPNVSFILRRGNYDYIQLKDKNGNVKESVSGSVVINENNVATGTEYEIQYVNEFDAATRFITDANGKISVKNLEKYEYYLFETSNESHGYKRMEINVYSYDGGTILQENDIHGIKFEIDDKLQIVLQNKKNLGDIEIYKKGENGDPLSGVEFTIRRGNYQYIRLIEIVNGQERVVQFKNGDKIIENKIQGQEIIINENNIAQEGQYKIEYVNSISDATRFITNSSGKILVKNLEIYKTPNTKYEYWLCEVDNKNYGYKKMEITQANVSATGGELKVVDYMSRGIAFTIGNGTSTKVQIQIKNPRYLGNFELIKVGEDGVTGLKDVEFIISQGNKYIQLIDSSGDRKIGRNESVSGGIVINKNNIATGTEYGIKLVEPYADATVFKTDENGKLTIKNLELYIKPSEKYKYCLYETANNNYGYETMNIPQGGATATGGTIVVDEIDYEKRIIPFTIGDGTNTAIKIKLKNTQEFKKLEINKVGNNGVGLPNVEFVIGKEKKEPTIGENGKIITGIRYIQLVKNGDTKIGSDESVSGTVILGTDYTVNYVGKYENATRFKTDSNGKIVLENLAVIPGSNQYFVREVANNNYGYESMIFKESNVSVNSGESINGIEKDIRKVKFDINNNIIITIKNTKELGSLVLEKVGENGQPLSGVKFKIQRDDGGFIKLIDAVGNKVDSKTGTVSINGNNQGSTGTYRVEYVGKNDATTFITDSNGKITIYNLQVNKSSTEKYSYTVYEVENPNYGYGTSTNSQKTEKITNLEINKTTTVQIKNTADLGNIEFTKVDSVNPNIKLPNVGFVIQISPLGTNSSQHGYIQLYNSSDKAVKEVKGTVTINKNNKATGSEYAIKYVSEYADATIFKTGDNGKITVKNLEVYNPSTGSKYNYKFKEVSNSNYGYEEKNYGSESTETTLTKGQTSKLDMTNVQEKIKISGYVWIENPNGKENGYDCVYSEGDEKITDLSKVKIMLRKNGINEKGSPDEFDAKTGKYTFNDVEIEELKKYEVVFVYNGFYYTTVVQNLAVDNGSKVKEVAAEREVLNNKFATVKDNSEVVGKDRTVNTVEYYKDGHTSTLSKLNFDTSITATTKETNYNLEDQYSSLKANATNPVEVIDNVNMGIVLREQPQISMRNDIHSVLIDFEGYQYNYKYNGRQNYYDNANGDNIGVKFEQENTVNRYTRTVYASDIQAVNNGKTMSVYVTYKMQIVNESRTLSVLPKQIINYFDENYIVETVGTEFDNDNYKATNDLNDENDETEISEETITPENANEETKYKSVVINLKTKIESNNRQDIYITFRVDEDAIKKLLNGNPTYHNASEILSYASYYGGDTSEVDGQRFITDTTEGSIYAGIDKVSQPGNAELALVEYKDASGNTDGTVLVTSHFENDTASAPSLLLVKEGTRKISGTVWEDSIAYTVNNEKLGDGIYKEDEEAIQGVTVTLHKLSDNSVGDIATYSDGITKVTTETDESGNYTFGTDTLGILPGKYVIKYTYNNEDYIGGNKNINVNDYKSTIIKSEVVKNAYGGSNESSNERWYLVEEGNRYSDARDDISLRPEYKQGNAGNLTIKNSTYDSINITYMDAYTPKMNIGIEFTQANEAEALNTTFEQIAGDIDFGIVERPDVDITVEKKITGLEIIAQNGATIIPKGNPSNPGEKMQYVKTGLDGVVSAEIKPELLQGAQLNLEYTITIENKSNKDYLGDKYYFYGDKDGLPELTSKAIQIVDYLDGTMKYIEKELDTWTVIEKNNIDSSLDGQGFISSDVCKTLKEQNYTVLTANVENKSKIKLYATRYLAVSDSIVEENNVEIIELSGSRPIKESTPGNHNPLKDEHEIDTDNVKLIITPPTGRTVNYNIYIIAIVVTLTILVAGIVIIKKKIIK